MRKCVDCSHSADAHVRGECVVCGCVRFRARNAIARQRQWIGKVELFVKNRWIVQEVRVQAMGPVGAAMKATKEGKRLALKPRTRIGQVRLTLTPIPSSGGAR